MSAYVVGKVHIDLLVRAAIHCRSHPDGFMWWRVDENGGYAGWCELDEFAERKPDTEYREWRSPSAAGQLLVSENVRSVHHRYPTDDPDTGDLPGPVDAYYMGPYVYTNPGYTLSPGEVFSAIDTLDYQSCETEDWQHTEAYSFLRSLRHGYCKKVDGYGSSPAGELEQDFLEGKPLEFSHRII